MISWVYKQDAGQHQYLGGAFNNCFFKKSSDFLEGLLPRKLRCSLKDSGWKTVLSFWNGRPLFGGHWFVFWSASNLTNMLGNFLSTKSGNPTSSHPWEFNSLRSQIQDLTKKLKKVSSWGSPPLFSMFFHVLMLPLVLGTCAHNSMQLAKNILNTKIIWTNPSFWGSMRFISWFWGPGCSSLWSFLGRFLLFYLRVAHCLW